MKKIILPIFLSLLSLSTSINALLIEGKFSYFRPDADVLRKIFPGWMPSYSIEVSNPIWKTIHIWGSVGYISKHGHSLGDHQSTSMRIIPIPLGLEYLSEFSDWIKLYAGLGPRYFFVHVTNHSHFVHRTNSGNGLGGAFRGGGLIYFNKHLVLDLFVDYSLKKMDFSGSSKTIKRHDLDLSGVSLGAGLGYQF